MYAGVLFAVAGALTVQHFAGSEKDDLNKLVTEETPSNGNACGIDKEVYPRPTANKPLSIPLSNTFKSLEDKTLVISADGRAMVGAQNPDEQYFESLGMTSGTDSAAIVVSEGRVVINHVARNREILVTMECVGTSP